MDDSIIYLCITIMTCGTWWFAFWKLSRAYVFLALAIFETISVILCAHQVYVLFDEKLLIDFATARQGIAFLKMLSYIGMALWIARSVCFMILVRWIMQRLRCETKK